MSSLRYIYGDVTDPQLTQGEWDNPRPIVIPHVVNDAGVMGAGVAKALYTEWPNVKRDYLYNANTRGLLLCEVIGTIAIPGEIYVQSMVAQSTPGKWKTQRITRTLESGQEFPYAVKRSPIRYGALAKCMIHVGTMARQVRATIHAPRFGSDLAGGNWDVIESLILELWVDRGINVTIYDYKG